ncbi:MAG: hydantoinase/carbamoylase family amidase [Gaiella sp.]|nr:hydantoinase/carbamoylase family amidase [Gaiella sp.]
MWRAFHHTAAGSTALSSAHAARPRARRRPPPRAAVADRRRERRAARRLDGDVGKGARVARRLACRPLARDRARRRRQRLVHAARRVRPGGVDRRPHGLGAQRRLARRLPQRARRRGGAAADRRGGTPPVTVRLVDWADEEGARFGRSLFGSSAAGGSMADQDELRKLVDRDGVSLPEAVGAFGVDLDRALEASSQLESAAAYLELHIEQGPVLESLDLPLGAVLGTFGVERHRITWTGQAAHAGSTPMEQRRDALAGAAKLALAIRDIARETGDGAVCTSGGVVCKPGIVTSVVETAEQLLDQRHLDAAKLASMLARAQKLSREFAAEERIDVAWERLWSIQPILFDETLIGLADDAIREVAGASHRLPSGPLHDAAEVARAGVPTVMLFVQSLRGLSHTKLEDTKPEHIEVSVAALDRLASKTIDWVAAG